MNLLKKNSPPPKKDPCIREIFQQREQSFLSEYGTPSAQTTRETRKQIPVPSEPHFNWTGIGLSIPIHFDA